MKFASIFAATLLTTACGGSLVKTCPKIDTCTKELINYCTCAPERRDDPKDGMCYTGCYTNETPDPQNPEVPENDEATWARSMLEATGAGRPLGSIDSCHSVLAEWELVNPSQGTNTAVTDPQDFPSLSIGYVGDEFEFVAVKNSSIPSWPNTDPGGSWVSSFTFASGPNPDDPNYEELGYYDLRLFTDGARELMFETRLEFSECQ